MTIAAASTFKFPMVEQIVQAMLPGADEEMRTVVAGTAKILVGELVAEGK